MTLGSHHEAHHGGGGAPHVHNSDSQHHRSHHRQGKWPNHRTSPSTIHEQDNGSELSIGGPSRHMIGRNQSVETVGSWRSVSPRVVDRRLSSRGSPSIRVQAENRHHVEMEYTSKWTDATLIHQNLVVVMYQPKDLMTVVTSPNTASRLLTPNSHAFDDAFHGMDAANQEKQAYVNQARQQVELKRQRNLAHFLHPPSSNRPGSAPLARGSKNISSPPKTPWTLKTLRDDQAKVLREKLMSQKHARTSRPASALPFRRARVDADAAGLEPSWTWTSPEENTLDSELVKGRLEGWGEEDINLIPSRPHTAMACMQYGQGNPLSSRPPSINSKSSLLHSTEFAPSFPPTQHAAGRGSVTSSPLLLQHGSDRNSFDEGNSGFPSPMHTPLEISLNQGSSSPSLRSLRSPGSIEPSPYTALRNKGAGEFDIFEVYQAKEGSDSGAAALGRGEAGLPVALGAGHNRIHEGLDRLVSEHSWGRWERPSSEVGDDVDGTEYLWRGAFRMDNENKSEREDSLDGQVQERLPQAQRAQCADDRIVKDMEDGARFQEEQRRVALAAQVLREGVETVRLNAGGGRLLTPDGKRRQPSTGGSSGAHSVQWWIKQSYTIAEATIQQESPKTKKTGDGLRKSSVNRLFLQPSLGKLR